MPNYQRLYQQMLLSRLKRLQGGPPVIQSPLKTVLHSSVWLKLSLNFIHQRDKLCHWISIANLLYLIYGCIYKYIVAILVC